MKKLLFIFLAMLCVMLPFAQVHNNLKGDIKYAIKTYYFVYKENQIYLRSYISIPLNELKYVKSSTKNGKTNYKVKLSYKVELLKDNKVIKKDSWKSIVNFQIINENAKILNYYDAVLPANTNYTYKITINDMYGKKIGKFEFSEKVPDFSTFSLSSLLWAKHDIRKANPDDYKYLIFNSLYIYPLIENKVKQYNYPRLYVEVYGLTPDEDDFYSFKMIFEIFNAKDERIYYFENEYNYDESACPVVVPPVVFDNMSLLDKGYYKIKLTVRDLNSKDKHDLEKSTNFIIY